MWTGSSEVMSMIIAHEWYREHSARKTTDRKRDYEGDAHESEDLDEKIYE
jgi:hypothetical protein